MANNTGSELAVIKKNVVDVTSLKIREYTTSGELQLPKNYSAENAMKAAWLTMQTTVDRDNKPALSVCTPNSISLALLDMIVQGLNPAKKQCYFIVYGKQLVCMRSYHGSVAVVKQICGAKDVDSQVIWGDDEFEYEIKNGVKHVTMHRQKFANVGKNPQGAYCTITKSDGTIYTDIMTMAQIEQSWTKSKMNPKSDKSTHSQFPEEMIRRTVINRACKKFINSSSDSSILIKSINRASEVQAEIELDDDVAENANTVLIDVDDDQEQVIDADTGEVIETDAVDTGPEY